MPKRRHEGGKESNGRKRARLECRSHLSALSDELLLRILAHLPVITLNLCQRVSRRFYNLAGDFQIWKTLYYDRWVRPRVARLPRKKDFCSSNNPTDISSKLVRWLGEDNLARRGQDVNWKRQYKIRQRWSKGSCSLNELEVAEQPPVPPLLVRLHEGVIFTADSVAGLRAWSAKKERRLLASQALPSSSQPTSLAVDVSEQGKNKPCVVIGFENGTFSLYKFCKVEKLFRDIHLQESSPSGSVVAIAFSSPFLLTMTATHLLSIYEIDIKSHQGSASCARLLHSLKSQTVNSPFSLSIRATPKALMASVAYAVPLHISGWTVGIQELHLNPNGDYLGSRLNTAMEDVPSSLSTLLPAPSAPTQSTISGNSRWRSRTTMAGQIYGKPTSISYSHPYLLISHADNTLTLYHVRSNGSELSISSGTRLWGHTSSISGAHVGGRGKAVSVSIKGEDIRVWELEGRGYYTDSRLSMKADAFSVQVRPEPNAESVRELRPNKGLQESIFGLERKELGYFESIDAPNAWIDFDEENVIIQKESFKGSQMLAIYDFT